MHQSSSDPQSREDGIQETREAEAHDDSECSTSSDTDMPILVGRRPNDPDSDSDTSDES